MIQVPVELVPWPGYLLLIAALGSLVGSLLRLLDQRYRVEGKKILVVSCIMAVLLEAIAMFLIANESELKLLGVSFDPFQYLQAAIAGILVGGLGVTNLKAATWLFPVLGRISAQSSPLTAEPDALARAPLLDRTPVPSSPSDAGRDVPAQKTDLGREEAAAK